MDFIIWHYSYAVNFYIKRLKNTLLSINHELSLSLIPFTLFSPWKRLTSAPHKGFNLARDFEEISFNFISRGIGAVVRFVIFIFGIILLIFVLIGGFVGFLLWLLIPFLSYNLFTTYKRQPEIEVGRLIKNGLSRNKLKNSDPGKFLISHLGISNESFFDIFLEDITPTSKTIFTSFSDLMKNIFSENKINETKLREFNLSKEDLIICAHWWDERRSAKNKLNLTPTFHKPGIGLSLLFGYTPLLDKFSTDMGAPREFTHHLIGRGETVSRIERVLTSGGGVILTGIPGVGKKTVVYEFAKMAYEGLLGKNMSYKRILDFDYNSVISGSNDLNAKKELLSQVLTEAENAGNVILLIRDIHRLINSEVEGVDFTDIFTSHLETRKLLVIVTEDISDYEHFVARNDRLKKFFEVVAVNEISKETAMDVLLSAARFSEKRRHIITPVTALRKILDSSDAYISDTPFPEKALELLDEVLIYHDVNSKTGVISTDEVEKVLKEKTGISISALSENEKNKLSNIEDTIHEKLINQTYPVSLIAKALRSRASGVINNKRPIGSFLFLGPTGVGKTETAKVLAEIYFGSSEKIIRFDMSEFAGGEGLERLIGSSANGTPGSLTTAIKNNPSSLLLLDEIEKAPPTVFNIFLSLLDEGKITDAFGKSISASHLFIVATSNAGSEFIRNAVQTVESKEMLQKQVIDEVLKNHIFTPEFLNRFDGVVVYEPLTKEHLKQVAALGLKKLSVELLGKGIEASFTDSAIDKIATEGYDPALGARPMRRMIELNLGDFIAQSILKGEIKTGDKVKISVSDNAFIWQKD